MASKSMKSSPAARQPKDLSPAEKKELIQRQLTQMKVSTAQAVLNNLCSGRGVMSDADCEKVAKNSVKIADIFLNALFEQQQ